MEHCNHEQILLIEEEYLGYDPTLINHVCTECGKAVETRTFINNRWEIVTNPEGEVCSEMVQVNLDGTPTLGRIYIPEEAYDAEITIISDIKDVESFGQTKEKLTIEFVVKIPGKNSVAIPMFAAATVTKGSGTYQSSRLYDVLEKADLISDFAGVWKLIEVADSPNIAFVTYLRQKLAGKKCRVLVKTVKKGTAEQYTTVDRIIKFI